MHVQLPDKLKPALCSMAHLLCAVCMKPVDNALGPCEIQVGGHWLIFHWCCWFDYQEGLAAIGRERPADTID